MKTKHFLALYAAYLFAYGIPSLVIPGSLLNGSYTNVVINPAHEFLTRFWGTMSIGLGIFIWQLRVQTNPVLIKSILTSVTFIEILNVILAVVGIASNLGGVALWFASAAAHLFFALGCIYFLILKRSLQPQE